MNHHFDRQGTRVVFTILRTHFHIDAGLVYCPVELKFASLATSLIVLCSWILRQHWVCHLKVIQIDFRSRSTHIHERIVGLAECAAVGGAAAVLGHRCAWSYPSQA